MPSPPAIAVSILDLVRREHFSYAELGAIIQSDPALAGRILRLANSGFYGLSRKVSSLELAIAVLGINALKNIALSFVLTQTFKGAKDERFDFDRLWRRAITATVAAKLIAKAAGLKNDDTFITSLLQDVGIAAMFMLRPEEYLSVLDEKAVTGHHVTVLEQQVFGFDHAELGAGLLEHWGLPENVVTPIRFHHKVDAAPAKYRRLCEVLQAADRVAAIYHGTHAVRHARTAKDLLLKKFGMKDEEAAVLIDKVAEDSVEMLSQFHIEPGRMLPYSQILQEANNELSRLNVSYEMLVTEHREATQRAERLARELKEANEKLRHAAFRDGLTGLFNHRYFQESLDRELARAERYGHPLSLILLDIDDFKSINDAYGHQRGDAVLKTIARITLQGTRSSDVVARYGGEEFAIVLAETPLSRAAIKAEACRAALEAAEIQADGRSIRVTISIGVCAYEPDNPITKDELISGADRALYRSKREGRNRVTLWRISSFSPQGSKL